MYEEIDNARESSEQQECPYPHQGDYELTQCAAYGPVNRDTSCVLKCEMHFTAKSRAV